MVIDVPLKTRAAITDHKRTNQHPIQTILSCCSGLGAPVCLGLICLNASGGRAAHNE
jgi:hypothetical protein